MIAQPAEIRPGFGGVAEHPRPVQHRRVGVLVRRARQSGDECGVRLVVDGAQALQEWQVRRREIARPPRQDKRVQRHDESGEPSRRSAAQEAGRHLAVTGPVELEPVRGVAQRLGDLFEPVRRHRRQDHRDTEARGRSGDSQLSLRMDDALNAYRRESQRRLNLWRRLRVRLGSRP